MQGVGLPVAGWVTLVVSTLVLAWLAWRDGERWLHNWLHGERGQPGSCGVCFRLWTQHRMSTDGV